MLLTNQNQEDIIQNESPWRDIRNQEKNLIILNLESNCKMPKSAVLYFNSRYLINLFALKINQKLNLYIYIMKEHQQQQQQIQSKIIKIQPVFKGKWLGMNYVTYSVGNNIIPNYQSVYRTTSKKNCIADGVQVIPIIRYQKKPTQIIVIANYRPPVSSFCLQFPSGLIQDENYQQNMKRELLQQTGYVCQKTIQFPVPTLYIDPWKSNQSTLTYIGIINGDDPNHYKQQELQKSQNIRVHKFVLGQHFPNKLKEFAKQNNYFLEGKLWSVCIGLALQKLIGNP